MYKATISFEGEKRACLTWDELVPGHLYQGLNSGYVYLVFDDWVSKDNPRHKTALAFCKPGEPSTGSMTLAGPQGGEFIEVTGTVTLKFPSPVSLNGGQ